MRPFAYHARAPPAPPPQSQTWRGCAWAARAPVLLLPGSDPERGPPAELGNPTDGPGSAREKSGELSCLAGWRAGWLAGGLGGWRAEGMDGHIDKWEDKWIMNG